MTKDSLGIWKCPDGHGEWLRNEAEQRQPKIRIEVRFQGLVEGLPPMRWRTAEKPILQGGDPVFGGSSSRSRKRKKKPNKPLITERYLIF